MTAPAASWQDAPERGTLLGIRILVAVARSLGRGPARAVLHLVAAWFVLFHPSVRRASRAYLVRVRGRASLADVYRHVLCFARVTLDRLFFACGDVRGLEVSFRGEEHLRAALRGGRGALLLVSHLGSFEAMRASAGPRAVPMSFVGYFRNARRINAVLRELNPDLDARLIEIRPDDVGFVFRIEQRIAAGELVATMGDRVGLDGKAVIVPFLGAPAPFPAGPYLLAAALGCPVLLAFGIYRDPNRYELYCEPFAERVRLPRDGRGAAIEEHAARFAARLEAHCRLAPDNWFNFYDFWRVP